MAGSRSRLMQRVQLIHWKPAEAQARVSALEKAG